MAEEINPQKNEEQYSNLLNALSPEAKKIILSEDTAILIASICLEKGIEDKEKIKKVAYQTTMLLLERIPQKDFPILIKKELQIDEVAAKKISDEINDLILFQIITQKTEGSLSQKEEQKEERPTRKEPIEEKTKPREKDIYKELID